MVLSFLNSAATSISTLHHLLVSMWRCGVLQTKLHQTNMEVNRRFECHAARQLCKSIAWPVPCRCRALRRIPIGVKHFCTNDGACDIVEKLSDVRTLFWACGAGRRSVYTWRRQCHEQTAEDHTHYGSSRYKGWRTIEIHVPSRATLLVVAAEDINTNLDDMDMTDNRVKSKYEYVIM